ncbi:hypothetical protein D1007_16451 [Hordeum vulgare]|nr:hypothetical protein D1007_16451 [Hordeum vulgare]
MAVELHCFRRRCHRPVAIDPEATPATDGAPLCLSPLYMKAACRCRLSPVLVGGICFSGTKKSMAPWFCTRSLVRQPLLDTTGAFQRGTHPRTIGKQVDCFLT